MELSSVKRACICALCTALCYVLPLAFHALGAGSTLLPMHLPVLLCGLICGAGYGAFCGIAGPVVSCVLSGMPTALQLASMAPELCAYGLLCGLLYRHIRTGKIYPDLYCAHASGHTARQSARRSLQNAGLPCHGKGWLYHDGVAYDLFRADTSGNRFAAACHSNNRICTDTRRSDPGEIPKTKKNRRTNTMNKADVIAFFDRCAPEWDADMIRNEPVIQTILDNAGVCAGIDVLDVACGTGVLIPDYLKRSVRSVTGIDISPEMIRIAKKKFPQESVKLICGDVESVQLNRQFDCVMVYNAFPHFPNPKELIDHLAELVQSGGRLSIAHGMSRAMLTRHHSGSASRVSIELPEAEAVAQMMDEAFRVDVVVSDDTMYQVCGIKK